MKPRITRRRERGEFSDAFAKIFGWNWVCEGAGVYGVGATPMQAYQDWRREVCRVNRKGAVPCN